jgi:cell division septation protein DedD
MTRAVAGVSLATFCGLLIGIITLSRNASNSGPQSAQAAVDGQIKPVNIIEPADLGPSAAPVKPAVAAKPVAIQSTPLPTMAPPVILTPTTAPSSAHSTAPTAAPLAAKAREERVIGQTYFVFGSFPKSSEARAVMEKLKAQGVSCTIERSLPGWTRKGWYSVVSVKGFESIHDPAYEQEVKSLQDRDVEPHAYKWRAPHGA